MSTRTVRKRRKPLAAEAVVHNAVQTEAGSDGRRDDHAAAKRTHGRLLPGIEAFRKAMHSTPVMSSNDRGWQALTVSVWDVGKLEEYELPPMKELFIGLHTGGDSIRARVPGGWSRAAGAGSVHLIPPETITNWRVYGGLKFIAIHIPKQRVAELCDGSVLPVPLSVQRFGFADPLAAALSTALARELCQPSEIGSIYAESLADTLLLHLLRNSVPGGIEPALTGGLSSIAWRRVRDKIEASLGCDISLDELARETGLSRFHFAHAFKVTTGLSPHRYINVQRIHRARMLLRESDLSIVEVALQLGFSSQTHFTDCFRRLTEQTPQQWRRSL